jgi:hypothetical protein
VVLIKVLQGFKGVFAVEHTHRSGVLQTGRTVGYREKVAGLFGRIGGCRGRNTAGEHGDKSQQGRHSHRTGSFNGEFDMTLSSSLAGKTELAFIDGRNRLNE